MLYDYILYTALIYNLNLCLDWCELWIMRDDILMDSDRSLSFRRLLCKWPSSLFHHPRLRQKSESFQNWRRYLLPPGKLYNMSPKMGLFQKEISSSDHWCLVGMLVFGGIISCTLVSFGNLTIFHLAFGLDFECHFLATITTPWSKLRQRGFPMFRLISALSDNLFWGFVVFRG